MPEPVLPAFGPVSTLMSIATPGTGCLFELSAVAVTVCEVPGGFVAVSGARPTVEKRMGSGGTNATGDRIRSASALIRSVSLAQQDHPTVGATKADHSPRVGSPDRCWLAIRLFT